MRVFTTIFIFSVVVLSDSLVGDTVKVKGYFPTHKDFPPNIIGYQHQSQWQKNIIKESSRERSYARGSKPAIKLKDKYRKQAYLDSINRVRSVSQNCGKYGIFHATTPLEWCDSLYQSAKSHSIDMATHNNFSHEGSGSRTDRAGRYRGIKSTPSVRASYHRYRGGIVGENIALGYGKENSSIESAIRSWLGSDSHCANMMSPQYRNVGMSLVEYKAPNNKNRYYWSQEFGTY